MSICSCDFEDAPRCSSMAKPRARVVHTCDQCRGTIKPGERYERHSGVDCEGRPYCWKMCADCRAWLGECGRTLGDGCETPCWFFGAMSETWDMYCDGAFDESGCSSSDQIRRLAAMFNVTAEERGGTVRLDIPFWAEPDEDDE